MLKDTVINWNLTFPNVGLGLLVAAAWVCSKLSTITATKRLEKESDMI